ncbi:hypothetical protein CEXT_479321 [Caerostris extrusa]|uniref:Uncharacterized protein n=1 Tax=Caerostris extrusa TaxID=172846 RepID=A0AAV4PYI1_CAEEX|nr:hypothetical protein CEXT_479321 [Caerostris extrusa]
MTVLWLIRASPDVRAERKKKRPFLAKLAAVVQFERVSFLAVGKEDLEREADPILQFIRQWLLFNPVSAESGETRFGVEKSGKIQLAKQIRRFFPIRTDSNYGSFGHL